MISSLQIDFHNTPPIEAVEFRIRRELAELEKFYNRLVSCRVEVEVPGQERRGSLCKVRIDFGLPPEDAAARSEVRGIAARQDAEHLEVKAQRKDASMAVHAAFNVAQRRLREFVGASYNRA